MHPTHDHPPSRIELDGGEILDLDVAPAGHVELRIPAHRALDLAKVLRSYGRIVDLAAAAAEVSTTEDSLARALHAAGTATGGGLDRPADQAAVPARNRLRAMAVLQHSRPALSHTAVVSVVDAVARWIQEDEHDRAMGLIEAAAGDQLAPALWRALLA